MEQYVFMTDSDSDLPYALKKQYDIPVVYMPYAMEGKEYFDDLGQTMDYHTYYNRMREGATPVTSALNQADYMEYFEPILKEKDLLFIAFSSQLSCTIQAVYAAREELLAKYPERKFIVVDTLSISGSMTQLVLKAHEMYRAGKSMEEIQAAARIAGLEGDIAQMPEGYDTVCGERGNHLSGGQRQRASLARALVRDPELLLLDDTLSAVDAHTEGQILSALSGELKGRTAVIIAHRLTAVKNAAEILYMDKGRVLERGTHEQLLAKNGAYAEMWRKQQREEESA